jgi:hypothetical protein
MEMEKATNCLKKAEDDLENEIERFLKLKRYEKFAEHFKYTNKITT